MLYTPNSKVRSKRGLFGIVTTTGQTGPHMRRLSFPVQTNSSPAINWRHTFLTTKANWAVLAASITGNPANHGLTDSQAWELQASNYFGILEAGLIQNGVEQIGRLIGCATPDAFYTMCQANRASLGLAPLGAPQFSTTYLSSTTATESTPINAYDFILTIPTMPPPNPLTFNMGVGVSITGNNTTGFTVSLSAAPTGITATLSATSFNLVYNSIAGTSQGAVVLTLTADPTAGPVTGSIGITVTGGGGNATLTPQLQLTTGNLVSTLPPPQFDFPNGLSCATYYDLSYNVLGFGLTYNAVGQVNFPATRYGVELQGLWEIVASDAYTNSYSPPDPAQWQPILFSGPYMPTPQNVLAAWEAIYGDLPASGNIKFQVFYIDPLTGTSGPAQSATAGWAVGTLRGFNRAAWSGPLFGWNVTPTDTTISCPGSATLPIAVYGFNGYGGTITFTPESSTVIYTGANSTKKALPAGLTFTVSPATVTIPPGSATPVSATVTLTAISGAQQFAGPVKVKAADSLSSTSATFELTLNGTVTPQPPPDFLSIAPGATNPHPASPGSAVVAYTLSNTGPDDIDVTMTADSDNPAITLDFDTYGFTVPAGTLSSPGTATCNLTITVPASTNTYGILIQVAANAGTFTAKAAVSLS